MKSICLTILASVTVMFAQMVVAQDHDARPLLVSPGNKSNIAVIEQGCPTFSWTTVDWATGYQVAVFETEVDAPLSYEEMAAMKAPRLFREINGRASSWTPSATEQLSSGRSYSWYVKAIDQYGSGSWSQGKGFTVETVLLSPGVEEALREELKEQGLNERSINEVITTVKSKARLVGSSGVEMGKKSDAPIRAMAYEGTYNTFYGVGAGSLDSGFYNSFFGGNAGYFNTGNWNTFLGYTAGYSNSGGGENTFLGGQAGYSNNSGWYNTFTGVNAGYSNTSGTDNTFSGYRAGFTNFEGSYNTFSGEWAGYSNISGNYNTFSGGDAGFKNSSGGVNTFLGFGAGANNSTGSYNTFLGADAGYYNSAGSGNVFLGFKAGLNNQTDSNKLYIDNCYTFDPCDKPLIKGDFAARTLQIDGSLTMVSVATPSDERYKKEIQPLESSLEKVMHLQGVSYKWKKDEVMGAGFKDGRQIGLIAQEVEKVLPELVMTDEKGYKALSYDKLAPVLIEAVKEQQKEIKEKDDRIERLEKALEKMERRLTSFENQTQKVAIR